MAHVDGGALGDVQEARRANSGIDAVVDLDTGLDAEEAGLKALGSEALRVHVEVVDSGGELRVMPHGLDMRHLSEDGIEGIISILADLIAERFLIVINASLSGVVIRDDKGAEERLAGCDRQRDVI